MTKEQERAELHRTIWQIANDLRGSVDGWDFKQYVLGMLFYRFISENLSSYINTNEPEEDFDYAKLSDKEAEFGRADTVKEKGFYILPSELFGNVAKKAKNDANLNETLAAIFRGIENFKMFDLVVQLTGGGPGSVTELASINLKREAFEKWRTGYSSAFAIILFVTVFGLASIYVKALNKVKAR